MGPRDWDELTVEEAELLLDWLDEYERRMDEAAAKAENN